MVYHDFVCSNCEHIFEANLSIHSISIQASCPVCGMECEKAYTSSPAVVMRPWGYSLKPGDKGYDDLPHDHAHYNWQDNHRKAR
jgi:putative FmdB family regulatory protein